ncbi:hypothetical protein GGQ84_003119, partial [Desulfitispora alkaliphila]
MKLVETISTVIPLLPNITSLADRMDF